MDHKPFDPTKPQTPQTPLGSDFITTSGAPSRTEDERVKAMMAHLGVFVPILVPFLIRQAQGKESPFVKAHATEALNFQLTMLSPILAGAVFTALTLGVGILVAGCPMVLVALFAIGMSILAAFKAKDGEGYRYPFSIRMVK